MVIELNESLSLTGLWTGHSEGDNLTATSHLHQERGLPWVLTMLAQHKQPRQLPLLLLHSRDMGITSQLHPCWGRPCHAILSPGLGSCPEHPHSNHNS